jgi:hypothetical protein
MVDRDRFGTWYLAMRWNLARPSYSLNHKSASGNILPSRAEAWYRDCCTGHRASCIEGYCGYGESSRHFLLSDPENVLTKCGFEIIIKQIRRSYPDRGSV